MSRSMRAVRSLPSRFRIKDLTGEDMPGMKQILKGAAAAVLLVGASGALAQAAERIGGKPDFNGVWQVMNTANHNLEPHSASDALLPAASRLMGATAAVPAGLGVVEGGTI